MAIVGGEVFYNNDWILLNLPYIRTACFVWTFRWVHKI